MSSLERHLQTLHSTATHFDKIGLEEEFRVSATKQRPHPGGLGVTEEPRKMAGVYINEASCTQKVRWVSGRGLLGKVHVGSLNLPMSTLLLETNF